MNLQQSFDLRSAEIRSGEAIDRTVKPRASQGETGSGKRKNPSGTADCSLIRDRSTLAAISNVSIPQDELAAPCKANGVCRLAIFGSALRDDFNSESDVDFLVEFEPGRVPGLLGIAGIEIELSELLGGHRADVRTAEDLSRYFRDQVLDSAEVQYP